MGCGELLYNFFEAAREDPRIGPAHISLYAALLALGYRQSFQGAIRVSSKALRVQSRLYGCATYYRTLRDLHVYGYILYRPSFDPLKGSWVQLKDIDVSAGMAVTAKHV